MRSQEFRFVWFVCKCTYACVCVYVLAFAVAHSTTSLFSFLPASCAVGRAWCEIAAESDSQMLEVNIKCALRPASWQCSITIYLLTFKEVKIRCRFAPLLPRLQPLGVLGNYAINSISLLYWIREVFLKWTGSSYKQRSVAGVQAIPFVDVLALL